MPRIVWTPVAESDLEEILYFFAFTERRFASGERILREIRDCVTGLASGVFPEHRHPSAPSDWLYLRHKRWLIFYRSLNQDIEVMRVIDAVRDLPTHLTDDTR